MTLTAGTLLHQGRYKIQTVLTETDQGIAYRACDLHLEQEVVLQTPKITAGETNSSEPTAPSSPSTVTPEYFLGRVQHLVDTQPPPRCCVLNTFLEANQPYIVLAVPIDEWMTVPSLQNWFFPTATSAPEHPAKQPDSPFEVIAAIPVTDLVEWQPTNRPAELSAQDSPVQNGKAEPVQTASESVHQSGKVENGKVENGKVGTAPVVSSGLPATDVIQAIAIQKGYSSPPAAVSHTKTVSVLQPKGRVLQGAISKKLRTPRWIPMGLVATSVIAGVAGATFGWTVRHDNSTRKPTQALLDPILNTNQEFPVLEGWPAEEMVPLPAPDVAPMAPVTPRYYDTPVLPSNSDFYRLPVDPPDQPKQETKSLPDTTLPPANVPVNPVDPTYVAPIPPADAQPILPPVEQPLSPVNPLPAAPAPADAVPAPLAPPPKAVPSPILQ